MKLKQTIGRKTLLMLILNAILGTGIFFLPAVEPLTPNSDVTSTDSDIIADTSSAKETGQEPQSYTSPKNDVFAGIASFFNDFFSGLRNIFGFS